MAFGFTPKYMQDLPLNNLSKEHFLVLALEAAKELKWNIGYTSQSEFIAYTKLWMDSDGEEISVKIHGDTASLKSKGRGAQFGGAGKNKANIEKLVARISKLEASLSPEIITSGTEEIKSKPVSRETDTAIQPTLQEDKITNVFSVFIPVEGYFITPILVNLNILIFLLMAITGVNIIEPDNESLLLWGANFRPMTLDGEWWRILTSCFLHIGIFHLAMNMYALVSIGLLLEPHLGKIKFSVAYLLTGITASMASLWWHDLTISAGASGAIFGMYGVFLSLLTTNLIDKKERQELLTSIAIFVGYNLINGLKGGIDNAAHIGGLIGGIVFGYAYLPALKKPADLNLKLLTVGALIILTLGSSFMVYKGIPNDIAIYDSRMTEFSSMEDKALEFYSLPDTLTDDKYLYALKENGIYYWKENIRLIDSFQSLDLPLEIRTKNRILREYCELRIKSYELLYKAISEQTIKYEKQIENYNKEIERKISEISGGEAVK